METKTTKELLKYFFSEEEKRELAQEMAEKVTEKQSAEDEKKAIMSDFKSRLDGLDAQINGAANKIRSGFEMRQIECEVVPVPERKVWEIYRMDTGDFIRTKPMTQDDLQLKIDE
jgi:uncharacterized coiled-coil DUF342 family protein